MSLSAQFLDELRARTSLSALVGRSIKLVRAGREWKGCCPFHQEKTPSFYVNDEKGFYHCFGCSAHGDAIRWMTDQKGMAFMDAVKELAAAAGLDVPAQDPRGAERDRARDAMLEVMARAASFFAEQLTRTPAAIELLARRGIDRDQIAAFGIGYAPASRRGEPSALAQALRDVSPEKRIALGLFKRPDGGGDPYDFFRHRIMIPIRDPRGRVIAFGGRAIADANGETRGPKYINSPDTPLFDKGRTLFNLDRAAAPARRNGRMVIVEGYLDVLALARAGVEEAVAPNGTALTADQLRLAWARAATPILCLDGDEAGRRAAARAARTALPLIEPGRTLAFVTLPGGMDPDDLERQGGASAVSEALGRPRALVDLLWQSLLEDAGDLSNPDARAALKAKVDATLGLIEHPVLRGEYAQSFRERLRARQAGDRTTRHVRPGNSLSLALEASILNGLFLDPPMLADQFEIIAAMHWHHDRHARLATVLVDFSLNRPARDMSGDAMWRAIEQAGLGGDARATIADATVRFGFLRRPGTPASREELAEALVRMPARTQPRRRTA